MPQIDPYQTTVVPDGTLLSCDLCPYVLLLIEGEAGYDAADPDKARCLLGPPKPNGTYPGELGQYPLVRIDGTYGCALFCTCAGAQPQ